MVKVCEAAPVLMRLALRQRLRDTCVLEKRTTGGLTARRDRRSRCGCEAVNKLCNNAASEHRNALSDWRLRFLVNYLAAVTH